LLPPPVDPRGQVPVNWNLTPCNTGLRATFTKVPHHSRSLVKSTTSNVRWQAPLQVRAPLSTVRNIPLSRDPSSYSAPLQYASAQRHAPSGSAQQLYGSTQQHAPRSLLHQASTTHRQPAHPYGRLPPAHTLAVPLQPSLATHRLPQQPMSLYQSVPQYTPQQTLFQQDWTYTCTCHANSSVGQ
jgi:hypothetical protein